MTTTIPHDPRPAIADEVAGTDWTSTHWHVTDEADRDRAARALAAGFPVMSAFGNVVGLVLHPGRESVRAVNAAKGRPEGQVASVTTTPEHMHTLFDWTRLPAGLTRDRVLAMIDSFFRSGAFPGPFGFRGPAAEWIPEHLTDVDATTGTRTVQLIAPGHRCPSGDFVERAIREIRAAEPDTALRCLAVTSANISSALTGRHEPAHYRLVHPSGVKADFGARPPGFVMLGYPDELQESRARCGYPAHEPNSTTIIDFGRAEQHGDTVAVVLRRHGSLPDQHCRHMLRDLGMELVVDGSARKHLPLRSYA